MEISDPERIKFRGYSAVINVWYSGAILRLRLYVLAESSY